MSKTHELIGNPQTGNSPLGDVMAMLPDGILWKKAKEYAQQFAIRDKPVESSKLMADAQDHYYRGMIEARKMLIGN